MATLQKLDILTMGRLKTETVEVEGGQVLVSEIGAADSFALFSDPDNQDENKNIRMATFGPKLVAMCVVDDDGNRLFSNEEAPALARLHPVLFGKLVNAAMRVNGLLGGEDAPVKK